MSEFRRRLGRVGLELAVPAAVLVVWWAWSASSESFYWPPLSEILSSFAHTWVFERIGSDAIPSLVRMGAGFTIGAGIAVVVGVALGLSRTARVAASPIVEFLRAIPPPALLPFSILVLGVGNLMKIFIVAFVCLWPVLLNAMDGVRGVDQTLRETARVFGVSKRDFVRSVVLPAASPQIFAGMRTSLSLALILMVISEMVASSNGIGYFVLESQRSFAIAEMWSGIFLLGILGFVLNAAFGLLERRLLRWHRGARASALGP